MQYLFWSIMLPDFSKISANGSPFKAWSVCQDWQRYSLLVLLPFVSHWQLFSWFLLAVLCSRYLADSRKKERIDMLILSEVCWFAGGDCLHWNSSCFTFFHPGPPTCLGPVERGTSSTLLPYTLFAQMSLLLVTFPNPSACRGLRGE